MALRRARSGAAALGRAFSKLPVLLVLTCLPDLLTVVVRTVSGNQSGLHPRGRVLRRRRFVAAQSRQAAQNPNIRSARPGVNAGRGLRMMQSMSLPSPSRRLGASVLAVFSMGAALATAPTQAAQAQAPQEQRVAARASTYSGTLAGGVKSST